MIMVEPKTTPETIAQASFATMHMKTRQVMDATRPRPCVMAEASSSRGESQSGERGLVGLTRTS